MNFKRGRAKNQRAGCLLCKPQKGTGMDRRTIAEKRAAYTLAEATSRDRRTALRGGGGWY